MSRKRLFLMAGGTGGHIFPGLAVAQQLQARGWEVRWLGTANRIEAWLVPQYGIDISFIKVKSLHGENFLRLITVALVSIRAVIKALFYFRKWKPDVVLGMGGQASGPGGVAAWILGIPVVLHEQNAVAGLTNQWLSNIATEVLQGFPGAFSSAPVVGNPVRFEVTQISKPEIRMSSNDRVATRILVMGGSQGSGIINRVLPETIAQLGDGYEVIHQSGRGKLIETRMFYENYCPQATFHVYDFIDDVARAYAWSDLIICRSGALTVSEISTVGIPAIFIPFIHEDRQQILNAEHLVRRGAAVMIEQSVATPSSLAKIIKKLDRSTLISMAGKARAASKNEADRVIADAIEETYRARLDHEN